ncbi:hypothetical protein C8J56DRAFT_1019300 [Mycena floridula]|nr:hypothetical protein C8J56DRAFT_1019300 [Mycena floridula]
MSTTMTLHHILIQTCHHGPLFSILIEDSSPFVIDQLSEMADGLRKLDEELSTGALDIRDRLSSRTFIMMCWAYICIDANGQSRRNDNPLLCSSRLGIEWMNDVWCRLSSRELAASLYCQRQAVAMQGKSPAHFNAVAVQGKSPGHSNEVGRV